MDSVTVYPETEEQLSALKEFVKNMKMSFEEKSEDLPGQVLQGIKRSLKDAKEGRVYPFTSVRDMIRSK